MRRGGTAIPLGLAIIVLVMKVAMSFSLAAT
jgi:hypothetical protein